MTTKNITSLADVVRTPFACAPVYTALWTAKGLLYALFAYLQVLLFARFTDMVLGLLRGGGATAALWTSACALAAVLVAQQLAPQLDRLLNVFLTTAVRETFGLRLMDKLSKVAYPCIEDAETENLIYRVNDQPEQKVTAAFQNLLSMAQTLLSMCSVLALLARHVWWAAALVALFTVLVFWVSQQSGRRLYDTGKQVSWLRRRAAYFSRLLLEREAANERVLFGFGGHINDRFYQDYETARQAQLAASRKALYRRAHYFTAFTVVSVVVTGILVIPTVSGALTFGLFCSLANALSAMLATVVRSLARGQEQLAQDMEYYAEVAAFEALPEVPDIQAAAPPAPPPLQCIEIRDLHFRYPGAAHEIFDGLDLTLHAGRHYAIVGLNGAGKTTLAKLLLGLYRDYTGGIYFDGVELRQLPAATLKGYFSVVYQDFTAYQLSVEENITLAYPDRQAKVWPSLENTELAGFVQALPRQAATPLGKLEPGSVELSGGQWQRLAIARAFACPAPIYILDEPTAALDPISERALYERFAACSKGKMTLMISHRLGATKDADEILLLKDGHVQERGTFAQLMAQGGLYAELYQAQRSWYQ